MFEQRSSLLQICYKKAGPSCLTFSPCVLIVDSPNEKYGPIIFLHLYSGTLGACLLASQDRVGLRDVAFRS